MIFLNDSLKLALSKLWTKFYDFSPYNTGQLWFIICKIFTWSRRIFKTVSRSAYAVNLFVAASRICFQNLSSGSFLPEDISVFFYQCGNAWKGKVNSVFFFGNIFGNTSIFYQRWVENKLHFCIHRLFNYLLFVI